MYAAAFLVTTLLHELAHAVVAARLGRMPTMHLTHVESLYEASAGAQIATALAGPLFSLAQGLLLGALVLRWAAPPALRLALLWLAYHGLVNFVGYVFSTSFAPGGDLNRAATLLGFPLVVQLGMTAIGYGGLRLLVRPLAPVFVGLAPGSELPLDARGWSREIGLLAGLLATPVLALALLPVPHWLALIYVLAAPLPLLDLPEAAAKLGPVARSPLVAPHPWRWALGFVLLLVLARGLLEGGIRLG
jgi:hypothetical protein